MLLDAGVEWNVRKVVQPPPATSCFETAQPVNFALDNLGIVRALRPGL